MDYVRDYLFRLYGAFPSREWVIQTMTEVEELHGRTRRGEEAKDEGDEKKALAEAVSTRFATLDLCQYQDHANTVPPHCKLKSFRFEDKVKFQDCGYEPGILV